MVCILQLRCINTFYARELTSARISYGNYVLVSWCLSGTTRYRSEPRWDRDFWFSPRDSFESLVFCDEISCHWVKGVPTNEGKKKGHFPLKSVILPLLAHATWKWLQIGTDMLLIITSTSDELLRNVNINNLEWPWTPKIGGFSESFAILGCDTHFKSELHQNGWR